MSSTQCKYWGYWCLADKYVMLYKDCAFDVVTTVPLYVCVRLLYAGMTQK